MKPTKTPLWVPILWFITTGMWSVMLIDSLVHLETTHPIMLILRILCVVASLFAAIANLVRYYKTKEQ